MMCPGQSPLVEIPIFHNSLKNDGIDTSQNFLKNTLKTNTLHFIQRVIRKRFAKHKNE